MIYVFVLLVSLCTPGMKECESERLTSFRTIEACESYAGAMKREMRERGRAGDVNCFDVPVVTPSRDSLGKTYDIDGRDD